MRRRIEKRIGADDRAAVPGLIVGEVRTGDRLARPAGVHEPQVCVRAEDTEAVDHGVVTCLLHRPRHLGTQAMLRV